jgi:hypothetical protein
VREWTLPPAFPRLAAEFAFLIIVGVVVGIAGWSSLTIVLVMGAALGVVLLIEWVAARERAIPTRGRARGRAGSRHRARELPPARVGPAGGRPEAMTMLDTPAVQEARRAPRRSRSRARCRGRRGRPEPSRSREPDRPEPDASP